MAWTPSSVTYGIRHKRLFGVIRRAGEAIDAVLALQGRGAVPHKCLTQIGWPDPVTARLLDDDHNYDLTINIDGIVLTVNLDYIEFTHVNTRDMFIDIVSTALPFLNPEKLINRIGVIEGYTFPHPSPGEIATDAVTQLRGIGDPMDFGLRIAFKKSLPGENWLNTIVQSITGKSDEQSEQLDVLRVSIDHQHYFVPDLFYTPRMIRDHYVAFMEEAELLQQRHLSGLASTEVEADRRDA
jgi:hypothetical protein